jgi:hypothetical protein
MENNDNNGIQINSLIYFHPFSFSFFSINAVAFHRPIGHFRNPIATGRNFDKKHWNLILITGRIF